MSSTITITPSEAPLWTRFRTYVRGLWSRREFVWNMALGQLRARNDTTALGILWYILNPLLLAGVYWVVFGIIFAGTRRGDPEFLGYLVAGLFVFRYTSQTMLGGSSTIISNSRLMMNIDFPRLVLPIAAVVESGLGFAVSLVTFFVLIAPIAGTWPGAGIVWLLPMILIQVVANVGLSALSARITVPFRDIGNLLPFLTRIWLYLSPIIWSLDRLDTTAEWVVRIVKLNPMFYILRVYRGALLGHDFAMTDVAISAGFAIVVAAVGIYAFVRFEGKLVQYL